MTETIQTCAACGFGVKPELGHVIDTGTYHPTCCPLCPGLDDIEDIRMARVSHALPEPEPPDTLDVFATGALLGVLAQAGEILNLRVDTVQNVLVFNLSHVPTFEVELTVKVRHDPELEPF